MFKLSSDFEDIAAMCCASCLDGGASSAICVFSRCPLFLLS